MKDLVALSSVSKFFASVRALDDVSLTVEAGETVALLGHNGAGKTTLFRIMLGFLAADTGHVVINGAAAGSLQARKAISYLPENVAFAKSLTGREVVRLYSTLKRVDAASADRALEQVGLASAAHRRCGTYSKGMRQRLGLAQAIVAAPKLLLLDEPTSGLDPVSRIDFYALIAKLAAAGTAVVLSSHSLSELEAQTNRIAILRDGRMVADGPFATLRQQARLATRIRLHTTPAQMATVQQCFAGKPINGSSLELSCAQNQVMATLSAIDAHDAITDIEVITPTLDDVYLHYLRVQPQDFSQNPDAHKLDKQPQDSGKPPQGSGKQPQGLHEKPPADSA